MCVLPPLCVSVLVCVRARVRDAMRLMHATRAHCDTGAAPQGCVIRNKEYLNLNFAPLFWKALIQEPITVADLRAVDTHSVSSMEMVRSGVPEEYFEDSFGTMSFDVVTLDGRTVELLPGGSSQALTYARRNEYADAVINFRMHEFDVQVRARARAPTAARWGSRVCCNPNMGRVRACTGGGHPPRPRRRRAAPRALALQLGRGLHVRVRPR